MLGAVVVQCIVAMKQPRITVIALVVAVLVLFVLLPLVPAVAFGGTAIAVLATIVVSWTTRSRTAA